MKLYLSSYRIPLPQELCKLVGKPAGEIKLAILPNAKDYYAPRAKNYKLNEIIAYQTDKGFTHSEVVDLQIFHNSKKLFDTLKVYDVVWAVGGNTFCLRQEMKRSGFDDIILNLLDIGVVYGGDSAGAVAVGTSLRGIESVDIPDFTEEVIYEGLGLIPHVVIPHADNAYFADANAETRRLHADNLLLELKDNQVAIVNDYKIDILSARSAEIS